MIARLVYVRWVLVQQLLKVGMLHETQSMASIPMVDEVSAQSYYSVTIPYY
jgi:hypothetical protein